ncbi:WD40-repeat-containing domain protein [Pseudomassariella vexata]|uniref:WD40-repeat-containing domain protein n=1 Tax=Pseudomassariella vexata TaxID=1141098 RepID=A0A1Y2EKG2_9PEZI|nr:WD40-repeat-containing domain protein [Pseudomassariella vexata]ORY71335.1 WD40-repeat-containing domain protein [Pseudomassariella vexata]
MSAPVIVYGECMNTFERVDSNLVTDYLLKRGYKRTEEIFRQEVANLETNGSRAVQNEKLDGTKYKRAFLHLEKWVENSLDLYKFELAKVLWPVFVYSYLELVFKGYLRDSKQFMDDLRGRFENLHADGLKELALITLPAHIKDNYMATLYLENKYRIPLNQFVTGTLFNFLERDKDQGGDLVQQILNDRCQVDAVERGPIEPFSFEAIYRRARNLELDDIDAQEGIPGTVTRTGVSNREVLDNAAALKLGPLPIDPDLRADVLAELEEEDKINPTRDGTRTLVDEFNDIHSIKKESADSPQRTDIPYPPSRARDVVMEIQKVRENRDRFRIEGRTGGVGPSVSVCMFTIHNAQGSVSCMDFSKDNQLVAVGTTDSYIRVWSLDGKPLQSRLPAEKDLKVNNRKLIGHSGPVYSVAFSDSITNLDHNIYEDGPQPETDAKLLISCSADGQVRLWSLEVWSCLCIYKGHDGPVFNLSWGPHGHYFASGGWDKTVRIWSQDHASAQRLLVGHDTSISALTWHSNGTYVFSASDEADKSIRMWSVASGKCVRVFTGHVDSITALECAPNGKILASADVGGNIFLWDIAKAVRIKRCRGHGRGGIWSLGFSVESNVLVSGGHDNTVRVWDVEMPAEGAARAAAQVEGGDSTIVAAATGAGGADGKAASTVAQGVTGGAGSTGSGTGKKKGKEVMITPDQISAFPTKRTSVLKVQFTRMNLVMAGGCYEPER